MNRIAVFPGTFDPFTLGHEAIVRRGLELFDIIIIAIGVNIEKKTLLTAERRLACISKLFEGNKRVTVLTYQGLTVDLCKTSDALFILRGIRSISDLEFETIIAASNKELNNTIETVFLLTDPKLSHIHSTVVRDIFKNNGSISAFVSTIIADELKSIK